MVAEVAGGGLEEFSGVAEMPLGGVDADAEQVGDFAMFLAVYDVEGEDGARGGGELL